MQDNFEHNALKGVQAPKLCYTAGGVLIHENKVLLVKHKKLGIWLNPGGHIDEGELPHEAAEREFFEETGIKVRAVTAVSGLGVGADTRAQKLATDLGFQPNPISTNLHWVNEASYAARLKSENPEQRQKTKIWKRGCEQHICFLYVVKPEAGVDFFQNEEETDGIAWFSLDELVGLETQENIRMEIAHAFQCHVT